MGKIDDIRQRREQQFAEKQRAAQPRRRDGKAQAAPATAGETARRGAQEEPEAKCPVCGKLRAVKNGVMADHQKGLGKHCAGSRQKPD